MSGWYKHDVTLIYTTLILSMLSQSFFSMQATVAPIVQGESLWWIVKRIGLAVDDIESKVDLIDTSTIISGCGVIEIDQSTVNAGWLSLSSPGTYCLKTDITADVTIDASAVFLDMNGRRIIGTVQLLSGNDITIQHGFIEPSAPTSSADPAGLSVAVGVAKLLIDSITITCADAGAGGGVAGRAALKIEADDVQVRNGYFIAGAGGSIAGTAGDGGSGILITNNPSRITIDHCTVIAGDGGDATVTQAGAGGDGITCTGATDVIFNKCTVLRAGSGGVGSGAADGGDGGNGIALLTSASSNMFIDNCIIQKTGDGGNGIATTGGSGGNGISIASVSNVQIKINGCTISDTGAGGNGTSGGDGGSGIFVGASNTDVAVHHCTISNTGVAGTGGTPAAGKAVLDAVPGGLAGASKVYANFAHDIANSIKFDLQGSGSEQGFALSNPPTSTAVSVYANVFI